MHGNINSGTVLCHGAFDLLHLGHIRHLQEARELGDRLVVSVTADRFVRKGIGRPHFTAEQRVEALKSLACVSEVLISESEDAVSVIEQVRPSIYVKGIDYADASDAALERERLAVEGIGGRLHITRADKWSSSRLLNNEVYPDETMRYLDRARGLGFRDKIRAAFQKADALNIGFVGELIIDEYRYVAGIGKPSKELALATVDVRQEEFLGGVVAASAHAEWKGVAVMHGAAQIKKTRFVDADFIRKLFEVYSSRHVSMSEGQRAHFDHSLSVLAKSCDVLIALDFGHGLMGLHQRRLCEGAKFLAVNSQSNAGNYGFNPVTNWRRPDLVCVDDPEARLATRMQREPIEGVIRKLGDLIDNEHNAKIIVTHGRNGSYAYGGPQTEVVHIPAFATNGIDTMGAGDAFLAVTAPLVAAGLDLECAAFVGNVAGAIKVSIVGHRRHVGRDELMQSIDTLLK